MYIDGLGYIDENIYLNSSLSTTSASSASSTVQSAFDRILEQETTCKSAQTKTYDLDSIFKEASEKYGVSEDLLKAVAYNESGFNPEATSYCGAMGIMQLMPSTAESLGVTDAYDPYQNIMGGAKYLSQLSDMFDGNTKLTIAAYNAGPGNVQKYDGIPPFEETQNYVTKVMNTLKTGVDVSGKTVTSTGTPIDNTVASSTTQTTEATDSFYTTSNLDDTFTYDEYELLMSYFDMMMDIISSIGDTEDDSSSSSEDDSLTDLFRLGNIQYNRNNIDLI